MMTRGLALSAALVLAACGGSQPMRSMDDPAVQQLLGQSIPEYYGSLALANDVAFSCPRYTIDAALDAQVSDARNAVGRGSLAAGMQAAAIDLERDVSLRSFEAVHGVEVGLDDLCAAGDAEVARQSALSALLVPAG